MFTKGLANSSFGICSVVGITFKQQVTNQNEQRSWKRLWKIISNKGASIVEEIIVEI